MEAQVSVPPSTLASRSPLPPSVCGAPSTACRVLSDRFLPQAVRVPAEEPLVYALGQEEVGGLKSPPAPRLCDALPLTDTCPSGLCSWGLAPRSCSSPPGLRKQRASFRPPDPRVGRQAPGPKPSRSFQVSWDIGESRCPKALWHLEAWDAASPVFPRIPVFPRMGWCCRTTPSFVSVSGNGKLRGCAEGDPVPPDGVAVRGFTGVGGRLCGPTSLLLPPVASPPETPSLSGPWDGAAAQEAQEARRQRQPRGERRTELRWPPPRDSPRAGAGAGTLEWRPLCSAPQAPVTLQAGARGECGRKDTLACEPLLLSGPFSWDDGCFFKDEDGSPFAPWEVITSAQIDQSQRD